MAGLIVFSLLMAGALAPFALVCWLAMTGRARWGIAVCASIAIALAFLVHGASRPEGLDPLFAMSWAMLVALPALFGGLSGLLLGWVLRRRAGKRP